MFEVKVDGGGGGGGGGGIYPDGKLILELLR